MTNIRSGLSAASEQSLDELVRSLPSGHRAVLEYEALLLLANDLRNIVALTPQAERHLAAWARAGR